MLMNVYNIFSDTILNTLSEFELKNKRELNNTPELKKIMSTATGRGYNIETIMLIHRFISTKATEYTYSNGLIYLNSEIHYKKINEKTIHTIKQLTITLDYETQPLINIVFEKDKTSIQQLLASQNNNNLIIPDDDKNISILKTNTQIKGCCDSFFESFIDTKNNYILLEKYNQVYPILESSNIDLDLLNLFNDGLKHLEIIYYKNKPIFTQLADKKKSEVEINTEEIIKKLKKEINENTTTIINLLTKCENKKEKKKNISKF